MIKLFGLKKNQFLKIHVSFAVQYIKFTVCGAHWAGCTELRGSFSYCMDPCSHRRPGRFQSDSLLI